MPPRIGCEGSQLREDELCKIRLVSSDRSKPSEQISPAEYSAMNCIGRIELVTLSPVLNSQIPIQSVDKQLFAELKELCDNVRLLRLGTKNSV